MDQTVRNQNYERQVPAGLGLFTHLHLYISYCTSSHTTSRCDITIVRNELKKYLVTRIMCDTIYSLTKERDEDLVKTAIMTTSTNRSKEKIYIDDSYDKDQTIWSIPYQPCNITHV